jgi:hypothetical protein
MARPLLVLFTPAEAAQQALLERPAALVGIGGC